jgi:hypothetical protein
MPGKADGPNRESALKRRDSREYGQCQGDTPGERLRIAGAKKICHLAFMWR